MLMLVLFSLPLRSLVIRLQRSRCSLLSFLPSVDKSESCVALFVFFFFGWQQNFIIITEINIVSSYSSFSFFVILFTYWINENPSYSPNRLRGIFLRWVCGLIKWFGWLCCDVRWCMMILECHVKTKNKCYPFAHLNPIGWKTIEINL